MFVLALFLSCSRMTYPYLTCCWPLRATLEVERAKEDPISDYIRPHTHSRTKNVCFTVFLQQCVTTTSTAA